MKVQELDRPFICRTPEDLDRYVKGLLTLKERVDRRVVKRGQSIPEFKAFCEARNEPA